MHILSHRTNTKSRGYRTTGFMKTLEQFSGRSASSSFAVSRGEQICREVCEYVKDDKLICVAIVGLLFTLLG